MYKDMKTGFTLIELLVVVLIIGILAAVAFPQYQKAILKAEVSSLLPLMKAINQAEQIYFLENGSYIKSFSALTIEMPGGAVASSDRHMLYKGFVCEFTVIENSFNCYKRNIRLEKYFTQPKLYCWAEIEDKMSNEVCRLLSENQQVAGQGSAKTTNFYEISI